MKKYLLYGIAVIVICSVGFFLLNGILAWIFTSENNGISVSLNESRINGVFLKNMRPLKREYTFGDSIYLRINESFIEKKWRLGKNGGVVEVDSSGTNNQLVIKCSSNSKLNLINIYWFIKEDGQGRRLYETGNPNNQGLAAQNIDIDSDSVLIFYFIRRQQNGEELVMDSLIFR